MAPAPPTTPDPIDGVDVIWREADGLQARIHRLPPGRRISGPVVIDVHGGAWSSRDRTLGQAYNREVAAAGLTVVAIDFRDGRQARHPAAVEDIAAAVEWVTGRDDLEADPDRIALIGSSSGGHLALHAALTAVPVAFVAAFWPPVDPLARYRYAISMVGRPVPDDNRLDAAGLVRSTEAYFGDEATMGRASIAEIVTSGRAAYRPPIWLVQAERDLNVPTEMLDELVSAYTSAGGRMERTRYPDEIHGFGHGDHPGAERFRRDLVHHLLAAIG